MCGASPGGGSSLRVPTGKQEGPPGTVSPSGGRVLGLGVPVRPRPAASFTAGAHSRAFSPSGRSGAPAVSEHPGPTLLAPRHAGDASVWPRPSTRSVLTTRQSIISAPP